MKPWVLLGLLAAVLMLLPAASQAQEVPASQTPGACGTWDLKALRGTYAFTGVAWQDLSELNPMLPKGYAPVSIIGSLRVDAQGAVTGWASVNAGGVPMTAEFVDSQFGAPRADCGFPITMRMKIAEYGGVVTGPYSYAGVIAGDGAALEIAFMMLGAGPGSHVETNRARRIAMNVY